MSEDHIQMVETWPPQPFMPLRDSLKAIINNGGTIIQVQPTEWEANSHVNNYTRLTRAILIFTLPKPQL